MPSALLLVLVDLVSIVHAAKTSRFNPWVYIILFVPGFGALAYVVVELLPEWFRGPRHVRKVQAEWIGIADKAVRG